MEISQQAELNEAAYLKFQRKYSKDNTTPFLQKDGLLKAYQKLLSKGTIAKHQDLERLLQTKNVRSQSGIAVVSVLTKPYPCPGKCIYCPTEDNVPKSYLSNEPAVMRAITNRYHPYLQVQSRLKALSDTGHNTDKISIRIIGGTWSSYPVQYQSWFVRQLFKACNETKNSRSGNTTLIDLQKVNENAGSRIVELSIETRQDLINHEELLRLRKYGVTKVELGVQSIYDDVLKINKRGSTIKDTAEATALVRNYGFKVSYQMMLNLYGSSYDKDVSMFKTLFSDERFMPDHLKIYPLALVKNSDLYKSYLEGKYVPHKKDELIRLIMEVKKHVPKYCRIERVIRDIPASSIVEGGAAVSNLRQEVEKELNKIKYRCSCIRCREIKNIEISAALELQIYKYRASGADEYFLSIVEQSSENLIGFCRLRMNDENKRLKMLSKCGLIREIHIYGPSQKIGESESHALQHKGWGKILMAEAEKIAQENYYSKMAVIAGVGVRGYFKLLGYTQEDTYMTKTLQNVVS